MDSTTYRTKWRRLGEQLGALDEIVTRAQDLVGADATAPTRRRLEETRQKWNHQTFRVAVLALAKTGKSSLLNAWLGDEFLPMSNTPETARMVRIFHDPSADHGVLLQDGKAAATGAQSIFSFLQEANRRVRRAEGEDSGELLLRAPLCALMRQELGEQRFELIDTPGPNESGVDRLRERVDREIERADVIVYMLDYTKLKSEDEASLFARLRDIRPDLLRQSASRLFFVLNKVDQRDRNALSPEMAVEYVHRLLTSQLGELNIPASRILPTSASRGLLARLVQRGRASDKAIDDFAEIRFGWERPLDPAAYVAAAPALFERSGMSRLESEILDHIYKARGPMLLDTISAELQTALEQVDNLLLTAHRAASMGRADLEAAVTKLRRDLQVASKELGRVSEITEGHVKVIERFVHQEMTAFHNAIRIHVNDALTTRHRERSSLPGWLGLGVDLVRDQVDALLGGAANSPDSLAAAAQRVEQGMGALVETEFGRFRARLEAAVIAQLRKFHDELEQIVTPVVRRAEVRIGIALDMALPPIRISLPAPSSAELRDQVDHRIARIVAQRTLVQEHVHHQRQMVRPAGLCRAAEYATVTHRSHSLHVDPAAVVEDLKVVWIQRVDEMADASLGTARLLVREEVRAAANQVQQRVEKYVNSYLQVLEADLTRVAADSQGRDERVRALDAEMAQLRAFQVALDQDRVGLASAPSWLNAPQAALETVLVCLFEQEELRRWLVAMPWGASLRSELPQGGSVASLAGVAAGIMVRRGLAGEEIFQALAREFPYRSREIARAQAAWLRPSFPL